MVVSVAVGLVEALMSWLRWAGHAENHPQSRQSRRSGRPLQSRQSHHQSHRLRPALPLLRRRLLLGVVQPVLSAEKMPEILS